MVNVVVNSLCVPNKDVALLAVKLSTLPTTVTLWAVVLAACVVVAFWFEVAAAPPPKIKSNNLLSAIVYLYPFGSGCPATTAL